MNACPKCNGTGKFTGTQNSTNSTWEHRCSYCMGTGDIASRPVFYAGIGSRETPQIILLQMENLAMQFAMRGFVLRSGAAKGADTAFERGCDVMRGRKVIRTANSGESALAHAAVFHPNWPACNDHARALHARNSLIMLGDWLDDPVKFVVCWTEGGAVKGGTGQALRIAAAIGVPVFNLALPGKIDEVFAYVR